MKFAEHKNINLVELREPTDDDWKGRVKNIIINTIVQIPNVYDYEFIPDLSAISNDKESYQLDALSSDIFIHVSNGKPESVHEIVNEKLSHRKSSEEGSEELHCVEFPERSVLSVPQNSVRMPIKAIRFKSKITIVTETTEILGRDYVAMIMSFIFENKRFVISPNGKIRESDFSTDR